MSLLPPSCKFTDFGCRVAVDKETKSEHQEKCRYRDVQCPYMQCRNRVAFCKLFAHIRRSHDVRVKKFKRSLKFVWTVKQIDDWRFCVPILFMSKKQNIFFENDEMMRQKETWHVLTFYQGTIEEADKVTINNKPA